MSYKTYNSGYNTEMINKQCSAEEMNSTGLDLHNPL